MTTLLVVENPILPPEAPVKTHSRRNPEIVITALNHYIMDDAAARFWAELIINHMFGKSPAGLPPEPEIS
jgi:hypothetical protein